VNTLGFIMAGWASDNKYALLGAVRAAAQLISYEIPLILAVLAVSMMAGSLNLNAIIEQQHNVPAIVYQPLPFLILLTAAIAELGRRPFDIPIGESELVGGPWVEYSGIRWSIIFALGEYAAMFGLSVLASVLFLGGWEWPLGHNTGWVPQLALTTVKTMLFILVFMWIGATFPRLRIDQLMGFCWKILLPFAFLQVAANAIVLVYVDDVTAARAVAGVISGALLLAMAYVIYMVTRQPSRAERLGAIGALRSTT
jgi:NADH-quinone oxidoreductase subunit H